VILPPPSPTQARRRSTQARRRSKGRVEYSPDAREQLRAIGDVSVLACIMDLAARELSFPKSETPLEGRVASNPQNAWRRAVPRAELPLYTRIDLDDNCDEFSAQACDYALVYRYLTDNEKINLRRSADALLVVAVLHNRELVPLIADKYGRSS
jgi:hypothetical protein